MTVSPNVTEKYWSPKKWTFLFCIKFLMCAKKWDLSDLNGDYTASSVGLVPWRLLVSVSTKVVKIYWCHRTDTDQSEPCLNPSSQNLSIRQFNKGQLYDLSWLRGTALEAETLQWSWQQKHWCGVFPNNFRPLCQRRHLKNVYNLQVGVFHSMLKVWQQHICRQMKFNCCYHSEILLAVTTGRHSAAAGVTADTRSASFSTEIPKWRDLFKSRLCLELEDRLDDTDSPFLDPEAL